jgi:nicotinamide mononucleotide transporter
MAIIGAVFSMISTRFIGKQKNAGNLIGIATTVNSGVNDFLFKNPSALLTYPITFVIHSLASYNWAKGEKIRKKDKRYYIIVSLGFIFSFLLVYLGFYLFGTFEDMWLINTVAITFGLSLGATVSNIFKYEETWLSWNVYNVFQLFKALLQFNYANVAKYIFYLFNASVTLFDWKLNGDKKD